MQFTLNRNNGNYFISATSLTEGATGWATVGAESITHSFFLASFSQTGEALWKQENNTTTPSTMQLYSPVFDFQNNIYLGGVIVATGLVNESFMGFSVPGIYTPGFVMKINPPGSNVIWVTNHNRYGTSLGAIALNGNEVGYTSICGGEDFTWGTQTLNVTGVNEGTDPLLARFNKDTGECISLAHISGNLGPVDYGTALAVDASGDYIVGGNFSGTLNFDGVASITNIGGQSDFFIAKYATSPCSPLAVSENEIQKPVLYPNPATDKITVSGLAGHDFGIWNVLGQCVLKGLIADDEGIDVSGLTKGIYVLRIENGIPIKFIKE